MITYANAKGKALPIVGLRVLLVRVDGRMPMGQCCPLGEFVSPMGVWICVLSENFGGAIPTDRPVIQSGIFGRFPLGTPTTAEGAPFGPSRTTGARISSLAHSRHVSIASMGPLQVGTAFFVTSSPPPPICSAHSFPA